MAFGSEGEPPPSSSFRGDDSWEASGLVCRLLRFSIGDEDVVSSDRSACGESAVATSAPRLLTCDLFLFLDDGGDDVGGVG